MEETKIITPTLFSRKTTLLHLIIIIIIGFAAYANSLTGKFIWDDEYLVTNNTYITGLKNLPMVLSQDLGAGAFVQYHFYRPLQTLTYMLDYSLWGLNPAGYHLTNILLHILVALAVYWLVSLLFHNRIVSFFTAVLFVLHPVNTEAVTYISGRTDSLCALFILLSFIFYIKQLQARSAFPYFLMIFTYILALASKENALILPVLLLLYHYVFKCKIRSRPFITILILAFGYFCLRGLVLKSLPFPASDPSLLFSRIPGFFVAITNYLSILFFPANLHMDYGNAVFHFTDARAITGLVITFLLAACIFKKRNSSRLLFFSVAWFFINLLPVTSIYPVNFFYMAEHWLYLPGIGFYLLVASALFGILCVSKKHKPLVSLFIGIYFSSYFFLTVKQNGYWQVPIKFYERNTKYSPNNANAYNLLCCGYIDINNNEKAILACRKAIQIDPHIPRVYYNLGNAYANIGQQEEAIQAYRKEINNNPGFLEAYNNLAGSYAATGKIEEALAMWNKVVQLNPDFVTAHFNLAQFYFSQGRYDLAVQHCNAVIQRGYKVDPKFLKLLKMHQNN